MCVRVLFCQTRGRYSESNGTKLKFQWFLRFSAFRERDPNCGFAGLTSADRLQRKRKKPRIAHCVPFCHNDSSTATIKKTKEADRMCARFFTHSAVQNYLDPHPVSPHRWLVHAASYALASTFSQSSRADCVKCRLLLLLRFLKELEESARKKEQRTLSDSAEKGGGSCGTASPAIMMPQRVLRMAGSGSSVLDGNECFSQRMALSILRFAVLRFASDE